MRKKCPKCELKKTLSEFSRDRHKKGGRCSWCKECIRNKKAKNHTKEKSYRDSYYQHNKERLLLWQKERNLSKPEFRRNNYLLSTYGITIEDYNKMFEQQNGCCAICNKHQSEFKNRFHIDHNHITGKIRGLLCQKCNHGLGLFQDSSEILVIASEYLKR